MTKNISDYCSLKEKLFKWNCRSEEKKKADEKYWVQKELILRGLGYLIKSPHPGIIKEYGLPPYK